MWNKLNIIWNKKKGRKQVRKILVLRILTNCKEKNLEIIQNFSQRFTFVSPTKYNINAK